MQTNQLNNNQALKTMDNLDSNAELSMEDLELVSGGMRLNNRGCVKAARSKARSISLENHAYKKQHANRKAMNSMSRAINNSIQSTGSIVRAMANIWGRR